MKLYEVASEYRKAMERLEEEGETEALQTLFEAIDAVTEEKVDNICKLTSELEAEASAIKEEERRLRARREARESRAKQLREYLGKCLHDMDRRTLATDTHTVSLRQTPPKVALDVPEDQVPDHWVEWITRPRKKDMLEALKKGDDLPFAHLERGESVVIK
jgi:hypothetical protein